MIIQKTTQPTEIGLRALNFDHALTWLPLFLVLMHTSPPAVAQGVKGPTGPFRSGFDNGSMTIIMGIVVVVFFIAGFLSVCARRTRIRGRLDLALPTGGGGARSRRDACGLDPHVMHSLPSFLYSSVKELKIDRGNLACAICLNEFQDNETLRLIPICNHVFHLDCIDLWFVSHSTCPVCRANLEPTPGYSDTAPIADIQIPNENDGVEANPISESDEQQHRETIPARDVESPKENLLNRCRTMSENSPGRSRTTMFAMLFPRSHSTGHDPLFQTGENCERFTLRLPDEVRRQLLNTRLNRTKSCVTFVTMSSERKDYRTGSVGSGRGRNYLRLGIENRLDRWRFPLSPMILSRTSSAKGSMGSNKPPVQQWRVPKDDVGEGSSDRLCRGGGTDEV